MWHFNTMSLAFQALVCWVKRRPMTWQAYPSDVATYPFQWLALQSAKGRPYPSHHHRGLLPTDRRRHRRRRRLVSPGGGPRDDTHAAARCRRGGGHGRRWHNATHRRHLRIYNCVRFNQLKRARAARTLAASQRGARREYRGVGYPQGRHEAQSAPRSSFGVPAVFQPPVRCVG